MIRRPPRSPLFPHPPLSRSGRGHAGRALLAVLPAAPRPQAGRRDRVRGRGDPARRLREDHRDEPRSEEHTSELQSRQYLVCRLLLEKKKMELDDGLITIVVI